MKISPGSSVQRDPRGCSRCRPPVDRRRPCQFRFELQALPASEPRGFHALSDGVAATIALLHNCKENKFVKIHPYKNCELDIRPPSFTPPASETPHGARAGGPRWTRGDPASKGLGFRPFRPARTPPACRPSRPARTLALTDGGATAIALLGPRPSGPARESFQLTTCWSESTLSLR